MGFVGFFSFSATSEQRSERSEKKRGVAETRWSRRASPDGEGERERRRESECNRYWVHHLPVAICEALREFNCFLPCQSSCTKDGDRKRPTEEGSKAGDGNGGRSCGAAFAQWLVAVQDGEGKGREIELLVGEEEEELTAAAVAAEKEMEKEARSGN